MRARIQVFHILLRPQLVSLLLLVGITAGYFAFGRASSTASPQPPANQRPFTIAVMPDTQIYTEQDPNRFTAQTQWLAEHKSEENIVFVSHLGDIVQYVHSDEEWQIASNAMSTLDGVVPYGIAPGNHDLLKDGSAPLYEKYFPVSRLELSPDWGGAYEEDTPTPYPEKGLSSYQLFSASGTNFIAFNLNFCPSSPVLDWTNQVLDRYPNRKAIITTHSFLNYRGQRQDPLECNANYKPEGNSGVAIWDNLVTEHRHDNIFLFLNGHDVWTKSGGARHTDYVHGHPVNQLLSNYQQFKNGGDGYLRLMTFNPNDHTILVKTYSPYLGKYLTDQANQFTLRW